MWQKLPERDQGQPREIVVDFVYPNQPDVPAGCTDLNSSSMYAMLRLQTKVASTLLPALDRYDYDSSSLGQVASHLSISLHDFVKLAQRVAW